MPWISSKELEALKTENATLKAASEGSPDAELIAKAGELEVSLEAAQTALKTEQDAHKVTQGKLTIASAAATPEKISAAAVELVKAGTDTAVTEAVSAKASAMLAASGHPPVDDKGGNANGGNQTEAQVRAELETAKTPQERRRLFLKNRAQIKDIKNS